MVEKREEEAEAGQDGADDCGDDHGPSNQGDDEQDIPECWTLWWKIMKA